MALPTAGVDSPSWLIQNRAMPTLYHAPGSRSCRVRWVLEELGVAYDLVSLSFGDGSLRTADYRARNPLGKVPTFDDDGVVFYESGAIVTWALEKWGNGRLSPLPASPERALYLQWFFFAEATLLPPLGDVVQHAFLRPEPERIPAVVTDARKRLDLCLRVLDDALAGRDHLLGDDFTAADIMTGYSCQLARMTGQLDPAFANVGRYLDHLATRPAFQAAFGS
jgi:glutathione S-transferase